LYIMVKPLLLKLLPLPLPVGEIAPCPVVQVPLAVQVNVVFPVKVISPFWVTCFQMVNGVIDWADKLPVIIIANKKRVKYFFIMVLKTDFLFRPQK
jgi:hypothetical protein